MMKLLLESWKSYSQQLLNEIKMEQVLPRFESKAFLRAVERYHKESENDFMITGIKPPQKSLEKIKLQLQKSVPNDIKDNYKAEVLNWIISVFINETEILYYIDKEIETFYQIKEAKMDRILSKSDIYSIKDGLELCKIVEDAIPAWEAYKQSRADKDADAGSNKIYEDEDWEVFIPENKGAACKLGKNTKWCTAAPGLEYYKHYHKQDDPLIIFISKEDPSEKYQFHYGTEQFMDKNDRSITTNESLKKIYYELHSIVTNLNKLPENIRQEAKTLSKNYQPLSNGGYKLYDEEKNRVTYYDQNGEIHREDGPAVIERTETNNVYRDYYNHGEYIRMDLSRAKEDEPYEAYLIKEMIAQELRKLIQERKLGKPSSETNLGDWFKRKGAPGKTGGWVDCNTCRDGKCKPCGRQEGEKRGKYPRCRPTPSQCKGYKRRGDNLQKE